METREHQEWRSRQTVNWRAVVKTSLIAGLFLFILSGGAPWSTAGTMNAIMGRDLPLNFWLLAAGHFAVSLVYTAIIALAIYRFRILFGLLAGVATGLILYGVNYSIFHGLAVQMQSPEARALFAHIVFSLIASGIYKGMSVPRPVRGHATKIGGEGDQPDDPEPVADRADRRS